MPERGAQRVTVGEPLGGAPRLLAVEREPLLAFALAGTRAVRGGVRVG